MKPQSSWRTKESTAATKVKHHGSSKPDKKQVTLLTQSSFNVDDELSPTAITVSTSAKAKQESSSISLLEAEAAMLSEDADLLADMPTLLSSAVTMPLSSQRRS